MAVVSLAEDSHDEDSSHEASLRPSHLCSLLDYCPETDYCQETYYCQEMDYCQEMECCLLWPQHQAAPLLMGYC